MDCWKMIPTRLRRILKVALGGDTFSVLFNGEDIYILDLSRHSVIRQREIQYELQHLRRISYSHSEPRQRLKSSSSKDLTRSARTTMP